MDEREFWVGIRRYLLAIVKLIADKSPFRREVIGIVRLIEKRYSISSKEPTGDEG